MIVAMIVIGVLSLAGIGAMLFCKDTETTRYYDENDLGGRHE